LQHGARPYPCRRRPPQTDRPAAARQAIVSKHPGLRGDENRHDHRQPAGTDFDALLATAARLDLDMLEFGCGNWSSAPHSTLWWREFVAVPAAVGYDDVFSIEHEDPMLPALEGVEKSVAFLRNVLINRRPVSH
jgi:hypothetical protein